MLDLHKNCLEKLPEDIGQLKNLRVSWWTCSVMSSVDMEKKTCQRHNGPKTECLLKLAKTCILTLRSKSTPTSKPKKRVELYQSSILNRSELWVKAWQYLVSNPVRWSLSFILGPLLWSSIFPTSREQRIIVQLCTNTALTLWGCSPSPVLKSNSTVIEYSRSL